MKCPNCKATIDDDSKYCTYCGSLIDSNKEVKDEQLLDIYIGTNSKQIKDNSFSLPTFLLGSFYFVYRRMYLLVVIATILFILCCFLSKYAVLAIIIRNTILAFFFNKLYCNKANNKVKEIEKLDINMEEKKKLCTKKGGTSIIALLVMIISSIILSIIAIFIFFISYKSSLFPRQKTINGNVDFHSLTYTIPNNFETSNYNDNNSNMYAYMTEDHYYCVFTINRTKANNYNSINDYLNTIKSNNKNTSMKDVSINNYPWTGLVITQDTSSTYYYTSKNKDYFYSLKFTTKPDDPCLVYYKQVLNSLKYK
jgi:hypothetical protein